ncbi:DNA repair protein endonuclease SAE2/CtIP C-terminus-domain-containing protein [Thelephora terrestris]|uniref:DNA repair protein endonuclease SAE2/CtIP C-terminus-domain-containing protein n=1 Tax=Thelephora terrestris TaxID=56493 RepID=A0A9P6HCX7_9AGAM|nr:DNA repair protein endonuclease SAE2/CtIP C-terminus-domain-containing protein [Thelephora terrestris]
MSSSSTQAIGALEAQIRRLKWSNDDLRSKLFDADQRASRLAQNFGFKSIQEAEDYARSPDSQTNVVRLNERLGLLEEELRKHIETSKEALQVNLKLREDLKRSQNEVFSLKTELRGSSLKGATAAAYDDPEKENCPPIPRKAEVEFIKKHPLLPSLLPAALIVPSSSSSSDSNSTPTADVPTTISSLQTQLAELQSRYDRLFEAKAKAASRHRADYKKWKDFKDWLYKSSASGSLTPGKGGTNISPKKRKAIMAGITERKTNPKKPKKQTSAGLDLLSTPGSIPSEPPTPGPSTAKAFDPSDTDDYEMDVTDDSKSDPLTEAEITLVNKDDSEDVIDLTGLDYKEDDKENMDKQALDTYVRFKGRGRYKLPKSKSSTINAEFEINPDANEGLNYAYDAVVRNKEERRKMHGSDCECCKEYYRTVGPLPPRLQAPLWRTPPSSPKAKAFMLASPMNVDEENEKEIERHMQEISKHRHNWAPPSTPPKYWSIGFPTTQEVMEINKEAEEMIEAKKAQVEAEASTSGGRYRKRRG